MSEKRLLWSLSGMPFILNRSELGFQVSFGVMDPNPPILVETPDELVFRVRDDGIECVLRSGCSDQTYERFIAEQGKHFSDLIDACAGKPAKSGPKE